MTRGKVSKRLERVRIAGRRVAQLRAGVPRCPITIAAGRISSHGTTCDDGLVDSVPSSSKSEILTGGARIHGPDAGPPVIQEPRDVLAKYLES